MNAKPSLMIKSNDKHHYGLYTIESIYITTNNIEHPYKKSNKYIYKQDINTDKKIKIVGITPYGKEIVLTSYDSFQEAKEIVDTFEKLTKEKYEDIFILPVVNEYYKVDKTLNDIKKLITGN